MTLESSYWQFAADPAHLYWRVARAGGERFVIHPIHVQYRRYTEACVQAREHILWSLLKRLDWMNQVRTNDAHKCKFSKQSLIYSLTHSLTTNQYEIRTAVSWCLIRHPTLLPCCPHYRSINRSLRSVTGRVGDERYMHKHNGQISMKSEWQGKGESIQPRPHFLLQLTPNHSPDLFHLSANTGPLCFSSVHSNEAAEQDIRVKG